MDLLTAWIADTSEPEPPLYWATNLGPHTDGPTAPIHHIVEDATGLTVFSFSDVWRATTRLKHGRGLVN
jgi:hypothetical protein